EISSVIGIGGAIFAALIGVNALSREEREHTAEFLLTHPVTRAGVVLAKLLAVLAACVVLNVACAALGAAASAVIGEKADAGAIALTFLAHFIMHVEIASICFLLGSFLSRGAVAAGLGTAFGAYVLYIVANITDKTKFLKYVTPFGYAEGSEIASRGGIHAGYLAVGLAITAACLIAAFFIYQKKDIKN
ncbi:MAG: ABC transporter permease subunit, partial [Oscillospiraceae bacterium]|nr:ABC transporter permease subunit [Oscillospiraceae bacterium]